MENKAPISWLPRPTVILLLLIVNFTTRVSGQDLYFGTTDAGLGYGGLFSANTDGSNPQLVFQFNSTGSGGNPHGNLILHNGLLYGATSIGATDWNNLGYYYGGIYSFDPATNTQTVLYSLNGGSEGSFLASSGFYGGGQLTEYPDGKLYGATVGAGANGYGTIFSFDPAAGSLVTLFDLPVNTAIFGPLTLFNYKLYGTSNSGGSNGYGFLFSYDPRTNIFTDLFDFGQSPYLGTPMVAYHGKLYGCALNAGPSQSGIIFSHDPVTGITVPVYSFDRIHGSTPIQIMVYKDKFYGTTQLGGSANAGTLFSFDLASGKFTVLHDNSGPYSQYNSFVIDSSGKMTGTLLSGGPSYGRGGIFQLDLTNNTYTEMPLGDIGHPLAGLVYVPGQNGTTTQTLSFGPISARTYGDPDFSGGATVSSGLPITYTSSDLTVAWTVGDQIHIVGAGSCTITATQQGNSVYAPVSATQTLTVAKASLLIAANDTTKYQYRPLPAFTLSYTGFVYGDTTQSLLTPPTVITTADANSPQGQYPITPGGAASNNYTITYQPGTLTIVGQAQNISFNDTSKTYGDPDFATATVNTGLPLTYSSSNPAVAVITASGNIHITGAGVDTITVSQAGNTDYGPTSLSVRLTVQPASLYIRVNNDTIVYQGAAPVFGATYTGLVNGDTPGSLGTIFTSQGTDPKAAPGVYLIYAVAIQPKDSVNYRIINNEPGSLLITPAAGNTNDLDAWFTSQTTLQVSLFTTQQTPAGQHALLQVFDATGRPCVSTQLSLAWGNNSITLPVSNLTPGVYIIRVAEDIPNASPIKLSKTILKNL